MSNPGWRDGLSLLQETGFRRLFAARLISMFGSAMTPIALPFAVLDDLAGTPSQVGLLVAAGALTQVVMQLFAGALADRGSRRRQMIGADLLAAAAQGSIALLVLTGRATYAELLALHAISGVAFALHFPAAVGLVPLVVPRERLQAANALLSIAQASAFAAGASAGGLIAATAGAGAALAIDAATFAVSAALIAGIRPSAQRRSAGASLVRELRDGWREFTAHTWLWAIVLQFTFMLMAFFGAWAVLGPVVAKQSLGGAASWGWIAGANGAGLIAGGVLALRLHFERPMLTATLCCLLNVGVPLLLAVPAPVAAIAAAAFTAGVGGEIFSVLWNTALHTRVAPEALSRVSSYDVLGSIALVPVGEALAGVGAEQIGTQLTLLLCAAGIVLPTLAVLGVRDVRELRALTADVASADLAATIPPPVVLAARTPPRDP
ncbi:MAG TPA: MFS transporter [Myxococcota bacterium]|nr:MFS transporter [Myxococcota bacterium]